MSMKLTTQGAAATARTITGLLDAWLDWERTENDAATATLVAYRRGMTMFANWLSESGAGKVTPAVVGEYKADLKARYSVQTVNLRLTAVRRFYSWTVQAGMLPVSPAAQVRGLKRAKAGQHKRDALTNGEVLAVLGTCDRETPEGMRDYAILVLMAYCGLRTIEVHRADLGDLRMMGERLVLAVSGKGHQEADAVAVVPVQHEDALRAWLGYRMALPDHADADPLFVSLSRATWGRRLALSSLRAMVKARFAGLVVGRKSTHSLRHSAITNLIRHKATPLQVQRFARHTSFDTTLIYYHETDRMDNPVEDLIDYTNGTPCGTPNGTANGK